MPDSVRRLTRRRRLRTALGVLAFTATLLATAWRAARRGDAAWFAFDPAATYRVERVVDGDTLLLDSGHRVRLLGVDTPETKHPTRPIEPWGPEASAFVRRLAEGRTVRLEFDRERLDLYDRVLAWAFVGDAMLNEEIVRAGFSEAVRISPLRPDYEKRLVRAAEAARAEGLGIWSVGPP